MVSNETILEPSFTDLGLNVVPASRLVVDALLLVLVGYVTFPTKGTRLTTVINSLVVARYFVAFTAYVQDFYGIDKPWSDFRLNGIAIYGLFSKAVVGCILIPAWPPLPRRVSNVFETVLLVLIFGWEWIVCDTLFSRVAPWSFVLAICVGSVALMVGTIIGYFVIGARINNIVVPPGTTDRDGGTHSDAGAGAGADAGAGAGADAGAGPGAGDDDGAHDAGVDHRDVLLDNILVQSDSQPPTTTELSTPAEPSASPRLSDRGFRYRFVMLLLLVSLYELLLTWIFVRLKGSALGYAPARSFQPSLLGAIWESKTVVQFLAMVF